MIHRERKWLLLLICVDNGSHTKRLAYSLIGTGKVAGKRTSMIDANK